MRHAGLAVAAFALLGVPHAGAETLGAAADAQASAGRPAARFGRATGMGVRQGPAGSILSSYARFDLSSLPREAAVPRAVLRLWVKGVVAAGTIEVAPVLVPWDEETVDASAGLELGPPVGLFAVGTGQAGRPVEVDVTGLVRDWAAGRLENYGLALRGDDSSSVDVIFETRESGRAPELEIAGGAEPLVPPSMTPRVPTGTVWFFDLTACPPEWTELSAARGRTIVGLPLGGTIGGVMGTGLLNFGTRVITAVPSHTHPAIAAAEAAHTHQVTVSSDGSHSHTVDPASISTSSNGDHTHFINGDGAHSHSFPTQSGPGSSDAVDWFNNTATASLSMATSTAGTHNHTMATAGAHTHLLNIPSVTSSAAPNHTHTAAAGSGQSHTHTVTVTAAGLSQVDVTMPYIQLLVCRKN